MWSRHQSKITVMYPNSMSPESGAIPLLLTIIEGRSSWPALGSHSTASPPSIIHSIGQLRLRLQEVFMQIYGDKLSNEDRPVARRWTFGALGLYGTILVLMILYAELGPKPDASLASGEATATGNAHHTHRVHANP